MLRFFRKIIYRIRIEIRNLGISSLSIKNDNLKEFLLQLNFLNRRQEKINFYNEKYKDQLQFYYVNRSLDEYFGKIGIETLKGKILILVDDISPSEIKRIAFENKIKEEDLFEVIRYSFIPTGMPNRSQFLEKCHD